jgi:hypothetical protein
VTDNCVLLGTPIGATLGHMLLQHKKELGRKRVAEVVVFKDEVKSKYDSPAVQIVFKIEDVPPTEPGEPEKCWMCKGTGMYRFDQCVGGKRGMGCCGFVSLG